MPGSLSALYGGRGLALVAGSGSRVTDSEGRQYLDFFNGHGAALFGHGVPFLMEALASASDGLWTSGVGFESPAREKLAGLLGSFLGEGRVFLCNSGAEAIEAALKLAVALRPGRKRILASRRGFHGRTCGALALTFNPKYKAPYGLLLPQVEHYNPEELPERIDENTAAVFLEPVQGEGGVHRLPAELGVRITEAASACNALLVADEIQSGLGRCGALLASELTGLRPDVVCLAKGLAGGLPIGAAIWRRELGDFPSHTHGSTYGGNELVVKVAIAALERIASEDLAGHARKMGEELRAALRSLDSSLIKDVRGLGLLVGVEVGVPALDVVKRLQEKGLLSLVAGPRVVRFLPSFAVSSSDILEAADIFREAMEEEVR